MVRKQVQLTERQAAALKRLAHQSGQSVAQLIRLSVDQLLAAASADDLQERRRRAVEAVGSLHSGLGDLAEDHDAYLREAYRS